MAAKAISLRNITMPLLVAVLALFSVAEGSSSTPATESGPSTATAQERIEVKLNSIPVAVTDRDGQPVTKLKRKDFRLFENDVEQEITEFMSLKKIIKREAKKRKKYGSAPLSSLRDPKAPPSWIVLVFDCLNSGHMDLFRARNAAKKFVRSRIAQGDRIGVVKFSGGIQCLQEFTADETRIIAGLDKIGLSLARLGMPPDFLYDWQHHNILSFFDCLRTLGEAMEPLDGRKDIIFFSSGLGNQDPEEIEALAGSKPSGRKSLDEIRTDVIHGPHKVLQGLKERGIVCHTLDIAGLDPFGKRSTEKSDYLFMMANETGGKYVYNTPDFLSGIARIYGRIKNYYRLGWYSNRAFEEGQLNRIRVELIDKPGLTVHAPDTLRPPRKSDGLAPEEKRNLLVETASSFMSHSAFPLEMPGNLLSLYPKEAVLLVYRFPAPEARPGEKGDVANCLLRLVDSRSDVLLDQITSISTDSRTEADEALEYITVVQEVPIVQGIDHLELIVRNNISGAFGTARIPWDHSPPGKEIFLSDPLLFGFDPATCTQFLTTRLDDSSPFQGCRFR